MAASEDVPRAGENGGQLGRSQLLGALQHTAGQLLSYHTTSSATPRRFPKRHKSAHNLAPLLLTAPTGNDVSHAFLKLCPLTGEHQRAMKRNPLAYKQDAG